MPASDVAKLAQATVALGDDLLGRIDDHGNVVFAPASISAALAMTYAGARGATATEMQKTLHFDGLGAGAPDGDARLHLAWNQLLSSWSAGAASAEGPRLDVANRLFGQAGRAFVPAFVSLTSDRYGAPFESVDYRATEPTRLHINQWVSDRTAKSIPSLLRPADLSPDAKLTLVNAVHVKGAWAQPFAPAETRNGAFTTSPGVAFEVPTMHGALDSRFYDGKEAQIVALPFRGDGSLDLEIDVVLPRPGAAPSLRAWSEGIDHAGYAEVSLSLPRFRVGSAFELSSTLAKLGMPSAFGSAADFSGMTGARDLQISSVVHQAVLEVNESGAEASAATAVVMNERAMAVHASMRVDRPFYVMLRDHKSGAVLFVSHVRDPRVTA